MITKTVQLHIGEAVPKTIIECTEGDTMWEVHFRLYIGSVRWTIPTGASATFCGLKKDGNVFDVSASISSNEVVVNLTDQMTAVAGDVYSVVRVFSSGTVVASCPCILRCAPNPQSTGTLSDTVLSAYNGAVQALAEAKGVPGIVSEWLAENMTNPSNPAIDTSLSVSGAAADAKVAGIIRSDVDKIIIKSQNLFNPTTAQDGYYCNPNSGTVSANANLLCTDFIPVSPGDTLWFNVSYVRYIAAFKENKTIVVASGATVATDSGDYTVPSEIAYLRLSFTKSLLPQNITDVMVNVGTALLPYMPYGGVYVDEDAICSLSSAKITGVNFDQFETLLGSDSVVSSADTLASGTHLTISTAPRHIKKNVGISALMKFSSFTSVAIGKGFEAYRGRWIVIDGTNITPYYYNGTSSVSSTPIPHGLTITDYLQISMFVGQDGICKINLNTARGTFQTSADFGYEFNYAPFIFGGQAMTDVKLTYSCADLQCPLWIFGDSYMGVAENRVAGQIRNTGFFNICINSLAGIKSADSYSDFLRMLEFSTPKFVVWALGMNGTVNETKTSLQSLIEKCDEKDIELILYITPNVPNKDHATLNAYVKSTGKRYVDAYDAVGANSSGEWYGHGTDYDMLSTDNVHPSVVGAKAIAMRFLIDVPEIMQYGFSSGTVTNIIDGDL